MNKQITQPDPEQIKAMDPEELLIQYKGLVYKIANRYRGELKNLNWIDIEDLQQVAMMALLNAQKHYEPQEEASFMSYACQAMKWAIKRALRIRLDAYGNYTREPIMISLDEPISEEGEATRGDFIESKEISLEERAITADIVSRVRSAVDDLPEDESSVIKAAYLDDPHKSRNQIAEQQGLTRSGVMNKERKAFRKLKRALWDLDDYRPCHIGVKSFNSLWASEPEMYVLTRERHLAKIQRYLRERTGIEL